MEEKGNRNPILNDQPNNHLHGKKLADFLENLVSTFGWGELGSLIDNIRCFNHDPFIKSSLKFLRKAPWAQAKVEKLYLESHDSL